MRNGRGLSAFSSAVEGWATYRVRSAGDFERDPVLGPHRLRLAGCCLNHSALADGLLAVLPCSSVLLFNHHDIARMLDRERAGREASPTGLGIIDSQSVKAPVAKERGYDAGKKIVGRTGATSPSIPMDGS